MTQSVTSKVAGILGVISSSPYRSLTEIARVTDLPLSTVHRLLRELVTSGLITRSEHGNYSLERRSGDRRAPTDARGVRAVGRPVMVDLAASTRRRVRLGLLDHLGVSPGESFGGIDGLAGLTPLPMPLHACAMGKALLAYSPHEILDAVTEQGLTRFTPQTIVEPEVLRLALAAVRRSGIASSWGEFGPESGAAVVVLDPDGSVAGAIGMEIFDLEDVARFQPSLMFAARTLTRRLGDAAAGGRRLD
jgi:DNA-binding IclR family transcriptional regulator